MTNTTPMLTKPENCNCGFPVLVAKNMNGHDPSCLAYIEWAKNLGRRHDRKLGPCSCGNPDCTKIGTGDREYKFGGTQRESLKRLARCFGEGGLSQIGLPLYEISDGTEMQVIAALDALARWRLRESVDR